MKNRTWKQKVKYWLPSSNEMMIFFPYILLALLADRVSELENNLGFSWLTIITSILVITAASLTVAIFNKKIKVAYDKGYDNGYADGENDTQNLSKPD